MPSRTEFVAHQRTVQAICKEIGADLVIYQTLPDLVGSVRQFNESITTFDCSVFNGDYVTGGVDADYLDHLERKRADNVKMKTDNLGGSEGKEQSAAQVEGTSSGETQQLSLGSGGPINSVDDTIGLHNSWHM